MRKQLLLLFLPLLLQACLDDKAAQPASVEDNPIAVSSPIDTVLYQINGFNSGVTLGLLTDNTFYYKAEYWGCTGGGEEQFIYGSFQQDSNRIKLFPEQVKILGYWNVEDPFDFSNPEITLPTYGADSTSIKTEYYKVDMGTTTYLLSAERKGEYPAESTETNDFEELATRLYADKRIWGRFFSKENKGNLDFNAAQIPEEWRSLFK